MPYESGVASIAYLNKYEVVHISDFSHPYLPVLYGKTLSADTNQCTISSLNPPKTNYVLDVVLCIVKEARFPPPIHVHRRRRERKTSLTIRDEAA